MPKISPSILFLYSEQASHLQDAVRRQAGEDHFAAMALEDFLTAAEPKRLDTTVKRLVVAGELSDLKKVMQYVATHELSLGLIPLPGQRALVDGFGLPKIMEEQVNLAVNGPARAVDLVRCNDSLMLFSCVIGELPLFAISEKRKAPLTILWEGLRQIFSLQLTPLSITTEGVKSTTLRTAACGAMALEAPLNSPLERLLRNQYSNCDGLVSLAVLAPISITDYLKLLWARLAAAQNAKSLPDSIGFIRSPKLTIATDQPLSVTIDGEGRTVTPATFEVEPGALQLAHGLAMVDGHGGSTPNGERLTVSSLPTGKEIVRASNRRIPFFAYASEQRFKELFGALRDDARFNTTYVMLMLLSTIIATVGLYLDSASVIIGAMLLAPLMAPIIAMAMAMLRNDRTMFKQALLKILLGMALALAIAYLITLLLPYQPLTGEMEGRLTPTVLDLLVAIVAGVAGAYTKSYKEILESLAGVAIAVALVPPLAVAGIGLGRGDISFFSQAFLLFTTNLIGIVLAATFTFRLLGFSPAVRDRRRVGIVALFLVVIFIPLFLAFQGIIERARYEEAWQHERFLVHGKYLIVEEADLHLVEGVKVLTVSLLARDLLTRRDLNEFQRKVQRNFPDHLVIRAKVTYIP